MSNRVFNVALFYYSMQEAGTSYKEIKQSLDDWAGKCHGKKVNKNGFIEGTDFISHERWEKTI